MTDDACWMPKGGARLGEAAALALALAGCGSSDTAPPAHDSTQTAIGERGVVRFLVRPLSPVQEGPNQFDVALAEVANSAPIAGASLTAKSFMPAMGHGAATDPSVTERGQGSYQIDDVVFSMPGAWELQMHVEKDALADDAAVTFDVP